ncbi:MAG: DUF6695 family protein [Bacteroidales bacterium]
MKQQTKIKRDGFAIALAWPETLCKQPGSWYDGLMGTLRISKHNYYRAGHAALVLVDSKSGNCHYFDFGRYHAPYQHGRARSGITDHGLKIGTVAKISGDGSVIENFDDILNELQHNEECHGDGKIHASYCKIDFEKAYKRARKFQADSPIPYGPFIFRGSNCSRFVNTCIMAGIPDIGYRLKLSYLVPLTPTPLNNVNSLDNRRILPPVREYNASPIQKLNNKLNLKSTLPEPVKPADIPPDAKWLSGEGAGSWWTIRPADNNYLIRRYSPHGILECENQFSINNGGSLDLNMPFHFEHLSHCEKVRISQNGKITEFMVYSTDN